MNGDEIRRAELDDSIISPDDDFGNIRYMDLLSPDDAGLLTTSGIAKAAQ